MYRIIGDNQREYGPVPAEEIRQWITARRVNGRSMVRPEDSMEWKTLSLYPEFAGALRQAWGNASESPGGIATEAGVRRVVPDLGDSFSRGFALLKENVSLFLGSTALLVVIFLGINVVPLFGQGAMLVLFGPLVSGWQMIFLKRTRGEPAQVSDLFWAFGPRFLPVFLAGLVYLLLSSAGFILIIPGVYLVVAWVFCLLLIVDKGLDFWPAMETSRLVVTANFFPLLLLVGLLVLLSLSGTIVFVVGGFFTLALANAVLVSVYEDVFGSSSKTPPSL